MTRMLTSFRWALLGSKWPVDGSYSAKAPCNRKFLSPLHRWISRLLTQVISADSIGLWIRWISIDQLTITTHWDHLRNGTQLRKCVITYLDPCCGVSFRFHFHSVNEYKNIHRNPFQSAVDFAVWSNDDGDELICKRLFKCHRIYYAKDKERTKTTIPLGNGWIYDDLMIFAYLWATSHSHPVIQWSSVRQMDGGWAIL